jgi:hypothetical protein
MVLALNEIVGANEAQFLALSVNVMISWNAEYPLLRDAGCRAD